MARVKGSQLIGLVKGLRAQRTRALKLAPPHLKRYFEERLLAASWYPEADFRDLTLLLGRLIAPSVKGNPWRMIGAQGAQRDFAGIYAAMVRAGDPEGTLRRMPEGWRLYRDNGKLVVEELGPGFARVALHDYAVMCAELADLNAAYLEGALLAAGAASATADVISCDERSARWRLSWK